MNHVWRDIVCIFGGHLGWYSFSTDEKAYNNDGDGSDGGYFDPNLYKNWISIIGKWDVDLGPFEGGFPTEFLYSMDKYDSIVEAYEEKNNKKVNTNAVNAYKQKILRKLSKLPVHTLEKILQTLP